MGFEARGSVVAVNGLSYSKACGILVPPPGIKPMSPALEGGFLTTGHQGSLPSPVIYLVWTVTAIANILGINAYHDSENGLTSRH